MYKSISPNLNFVEEEKKVEKFWEDENIFEKSIAEREGDKPYVFYDGPPTANGKPHIGHVLTRVIKDMIPRYRTMKGYMVPRKLAGIPTVCQLSLRLKSFWGLTARNRSSNTVLNPLSSTARKAFGNTRVCGRISQKPSAFGRIWSTLTLPMIIIL